MEIFCFCFWLNHNICVNFYFSTLMVIYPCQWWWWWLRPNIKKNLFQIHNVCVCVSFYYAHNWRLDDRSVFFVVVVKWWLQQTYTKRTHTHYYTPLPRCRKIQSNKKNLCLKNIEDHELNFIYLFDDDDRKEKENWRKTASHDLTVGLVVA